MKAMQWAMAGLGLLGLLAIVRLELNVQAARVELGHERQLREEVREGVSLSEYVKRDRADPSVDSHRQLTEDEDDPEDTVKNAIQGAAPDQSCTIEIWHDALGALAGVLTGDGGGQMDCSGDPDTKGDCVETIEGLISSAGPEAEFAADIISKMDGTNAKEVCTKICTQGCGNVLGWAMWFESPCIVDAAPVATFRIVCLPPWGLVAVVCVLVVLYGCCKACCDDEDKNQRSALTIQLTRM
jgi:hypothetical protein